MPDITSGLSENQRLIAVGIIGFLVGVIATSLLFAVQGSRSTSSVSDEADTADKEIVPPSSAATEEPPPPPPVVSGGIDRVTVNDQPAGDRVILTNVMLANSSWVAVHEELDGIPGSILGAARFDEGTSQGDVRLLRATQPGQRYYIRLYRDDGDRQFDFTKDMLIVGRNNQPIQDTFRAVE